MPSVYCTQCGHANPDDARFCSNCGTPLTRSVPPVTSEPNDSTSTISLGAVEAAESDLGDELSTDQAGVEALPPNTALLVVKRGPNAGSRFLLDSDSTTAGRHPESDIFLDDVTVSRRQPQRHLRQPRADRRGGTVRRRRGPDRKVPAGVPHQSPGHPPSRRRRKGRRSPARRTVRRLDVDGVVVRETCAGRVRGGSVSAEGGVRRGRE
jgi:hypothetical protein